jgi:hypothetical protein
VIETAEDGTDNAESVRTGAEQVEDCLQPCGARRITALIKPSNAGAKRIHRLRRIGALHQDLHQCDVFGQPGGGALKRAVELRRQLGEPIGDFRHNRRGRSSA